jgi:RNA 3'-terminal phosphate cyclase (ATP)
LVTGKPFTIENIRGKRKKPGLLRQHLTAVRAASAIGGTAVEGAGVGMTELQFAPGAIKPGDYEFSVGTAGSATLVLQAVLPALILAKENSTLRLKGGTHNPWAPPFGFLKESFLPIVKRMGPAVDAQLISPGFYPAGGGELVVAIQPSNELKYLDLVERGEAVNTRVVAQVANLSANIARKEARVIAKKLELTNESIEIEEMENSIGPGNVVSVFVESDQVTEVITGFGEKGVSAEKVGKRAANDVASYLESGAAVGRYLADQLLIPMALGGGGRFTTVKPTEHTATNIDVIKRFLNVEIEMSERKANTWWIEVRKGK